VTKEMGIVNLCMTGLGARCVMIGDARGRVPGRRGEDAYPA